MVTVALSLDWDFPEHHCLGPVSCLHRWIPRRTRGAPTFKTLSPTVILNSFSDTFSIDVSNPIISESNSTEIEKSKASLYRIAPASLDGKHDQLYDVHSKSFLGMSV